MEQLRYKDHLGAILEPSEGDFDAGGSTFGCAFIDDNEPNTTFLYYTGARDRGWSHASIGLAVSNDGENFRKLRELNPVIDGEKREFNSCQSVTPAVVRVGNHYYMFFAGRNRRFIVGRKIGVACADDPRGPWRVIRVLAKPEYNWEGGNIDLGPNVAKFNQGQTLIYYSNVVNRNPMSILRGQRTLRRHIGILKVDIRSPTSVSAERYDGNPLKHLNGPAGSPSESVFCPGYLAVDGRHFLFPSMSTYSIGPPYHQYVGIASDDNPFFGKVRRVSVILDGSSERSEVLNAESQLALDTASPIVRDDKIYMYYSAMDRHDDVWKIALSVLDKGFLRNVP